MATFIFPFCSVHRGLLLGSVSIDEVDEGWVRTG